MNNLTLINFVLFIFGPLREDRLTLVSYGVAVFARYCLLTSLFVGQVLLAIQVLCSIVAFVIRFQLAGLLYSVVS